MQPSETENKRLRLLADLAILDTGREAVFDDLTQLAARLFKVPVCAISLIDANRQWFKSSVGLDVTQTEREAAFCDHTIRSDDVMIVPDATRDVRFKDNRLVTGNPNIRFYAGAPVQFAGFAIGARCLIDDQNRTTFSADDAESLRLFANIVSSIIELKKNDWKQILDHAAVA
jgi:GAF domain-containing protein